MRKGDEEESISSTATDGDKTKVQAQQRVFTSGEAMGGSGTRAPSDASSLVEANLFQPTGPANLQHSTVSVEYQIGGKDCCSSLHSLPHRAVMHEVFYMQQAYHVIKT